jgi:hypothetical protein
MSSVDDDDDDAEEHVDMDAGVGATDDAEVNPEENVVKAPGHHRTTRRVAMRKLLKRTLPVFDCGSCRCGEPPFDLDIIGHANAAALAEAGCEQDR